MHDCGNDCLFHGGLLGDDGARLPGEGRAHMQLDPMGAGIFDGPHRRLGAAIGGHLEKLIKGDVLHLSGVGDDSWIAGEHTRYIGVELAGLGAERMGQRHRRGVGTATSEERDIALGGLALGPTHYRNTAGGQ